MIAAVINSYNLLKVTLGVFETEQIARRRLLDLGCKEMTFQERYPKSEFKDINRSKVKHLYITEIFCDYMEKRDLPFYSTGAGMDEMWIDFEPIVLNEISFGYDDD